MQTPTIAQNRSNADTIIDARRYRHWQQNTQATKVFKAGNRPASFASARPVLPRTVRLAVLADGVTACLPGAVLARTASTLVWWVDRDAWGRDN